MENSKLIQDFLDGRLDSESEDILFNEIANNQTVREEFKSYLAIELALKNDSKTFIPPLSSTTGILTKIGFAIPGAIAGGAAVSTLSDKFGFLSNISHGIYSALVSAVVTAVTVVGIYTYTDVGKSDKDIKPNENISTIQNQKNNDLIEAQKEISNLKNQLTTAQTNKPKPIIKYVYIDRVKESTITKKEVTTKTEQISEKSLASEPIKQPKMNSIESYSNGFSSSLFDKNIDQRSFDGPYKTIGNSNYKFGNFSNPSKIGLGVEFRGLQEWSTTYPAVKETNLPKFGNMGITLSYNLTDNFTLLADGRQEFFYQEFTGIDNSGNKNLYQQFPNFYSVSAGLRYNIFDFENVSAFGQILVGGNKAGLVSRAMLGLEILPQNNYSFFIGVEGNMFNYFHNEQNFNSSKIGLNYGIKINL